MGKVLWPAFPNDSISAALFSPDSTENAASSNDSDLAASPDDISTKNSDLGKKILLSARMILFSGSYSKCQDFLQTKLFKLFFDDEFNAF